MCRDGIVLAGSRRLPLFLFSLGGIGSGRLIHLGVDNSVSGVRHGLAHFKERRLPLMFQHDLLCVGQRRLGSGRLQHGGIFHRRSGSLGGRSCLGNVFLIICHLQTSFCGMKKASPVAGCKKYSPLSVFIYENAPLVLWARNS